MGGADFDPPPPLGDTDQSRYVKVKTVEEARGPEMRTWIEEAGRLPGWKGVYVLDITDAEAEELGQTGRKQQRRGRRARSTS